MVVMVAAQVFGELEATEVVVAGQPAHDPRLGQRGEAAVGRALWQAMTAGPRSVCRFQYLGDRERPGGVAQHPPHGPTPARVALVERGEPALDLHVQPVRLAAA